MKKPDFELLTGVVLVLLLSISAPVYARYETPAEYREAQFRAEQQREARIRAERERHVERRIEKKIEKRAERRAEKRIERRLVLD